MASSLLILLRPGLASAFVASALVGALAVIEPGAWALLLPTALGAYIGMTLAWRLLVPTGTARMLQALVAGVVGSLIAYLLVWLVIGFYQWMAYSQTAAMAGMLVMGTIGFMIVAPLVLLAGAITGLLVRWLSKPSPTTIS